MIVRSLKWKLGQSIPIWSIIKHSGVLINNKQSISISLSNRNKLKFKPDYKLLEPIRSHFSNGNCSSMHFNRKNPKADYKCPQMKNIHTFVKRPRVRKSVRDLFKSIGIVENDSDNKTRDPIFAAFIINIKFNANCKQAQARSAPHNYLITTKLLHIYFEKNARRRAIWILHQAQASWILRVFPQQKTKIPVQLPRNRKKKMN